MKKKTKYLILPVTILTIAVGGFLTFLAHFGMTQGWWKLIAIVTIPPIITWAIVRVVEETS